MKAWQQYLMVDQKRKSNNNNFEIKEVHDVKIEGGFLVVELDHLSAYALVGSNVEANNTLNPTTGDKIILYAIMLGISIIGLISIGVYTKKKYFAKQKNRILNPIFIAKKVIKCYNKTQFKGNIQKEMVRKYE